MKTWLIVVLVILLMIFFSCATQKELTSPSGVSAEKGYDFYLDAGIRFLNQKNYGKSIEQFKKAIVLNSNSSQAYNLLGVSYFQQNNTNLAKMQFEKALKIDPSYAKAYNNLGSLYYMRQEFDKAKILYKKALSLSPKLVSAHFSLGSLLVLEGQTEEGFSFLSKGIELDPDYLERNEHLITTYTSAAFGNAEIYFTYAKLYASAGNLEKTVEYLKKAQKAGFKDWDRIEQEKDFEKVKNDERVIHFIRKQPE